jgi:hypothetical protein
LSDTDDIVAALVPVTAAFQALGIQHYVGGSVASTFHGAIRSTMDVDVVCDLREEQVDAFLKAFNTDYYVSGPAVRDAVKRRSSFNLIHLPTSFKVDVFVSRGRPFDRAAMSRATPCVLREEDGFAAPMATAEDSIVSKLEWYRLGDEVSERQWDDVSRLVQLLGDSLDIPHMKRMAASIGVGDLLDRLLRQRGQQ